MVHMGHFTPVNGYGFFIKKGGACYQAPPFRTLRQMEKEALLL
jgi:hypothetical protein